MSVELSIFVSYSQIAVFLPSLEEPFNPWTDEDVENGYSWRPGSVSFRTPEEAGDYLVLIQSRDGQGVPMASAISVPFAVPADGLVEVGSISDTKVIEIGAGEYTLSFELIAEAAQSNSVRLSFCKRSKGEVS